MVRLDRRQKLEFGETLQACAKREAREEAGIEITRLRLLCLATIIVEDQHWVDRGQFLADIASGEPHTAAPDEIDGWTSCSIRKRLPSPIFEPAQRALEAHRSGPHFERRDLGSADDYV
ncbi:MAG: NUDIX domain-containing protein [Marinilabiliales bacterium]|nr:NUDIX domain-containing protein [Marinilabiliales bacterium]